MSQIPRTVFVIPLRPRQLVIPCVLLAGLATLLLSGKESSARYAPVPADPPAELRLIPSDTFAVAHFNVAGLMKQDLVKSFVPMIFGGDFDQAADSGERLFGVKFSDIDAVALLTGQRQNVTVVTTRRGFDRDSVVKAVAPQSIEQTHKDKKFFGTKREPRNFKDRIKDGFKDEGIRKEKIRDGFKDGRDFKKEGDFAQDKDFARDKDFPKKDRGGRETGIESWAPAVYFVGDRTFVTGNGQSVMNFIETAAKPDDTSPLAAALSAAGKRHVTLGLALPEELRNEAEGQLRRSTRFEPTLGMLLYNFKPLLSAKHGVLTVDLGEETRVDGAITFADGRGAELGVDGVKGALLLLKGGLLMLEDQAQGTLGELKPDSPLLKLSGQLRTALADATIKADGAAVKLSLKAQTDAANVKAIMEETAEKVKTAAGRTQSMNNLKHITLAIIKTADDNNGEMPPAVVYSKDGKPLYSWRVAILPNLDEDRLYKQLKLDEPWDSEHNKPLLAKTPQVFQMGGVKAPEGMTFFQIFSGAGTMSEQNRRVRFPASFTDGTSQTILLTEAAEAVHWAAPKDIPYGERVSPLKQIGKHYGKGTLVSFADGSVRMMPATVKERDLRAAITPNGNEVIGESFFEDDDPFGGEKPRYKEKKSSDKVRPPDIRKDEKFIDRKFNK